MSKSIKLKNDNYIDSTSIVHNKKLLSDILNSDSGWINLNNIIIYRKIDKIMTVRAFCDNKMSLKAGEYTNVGNLPNAFRPTIEIVSNWSRIGEGSVGTLKIKPDGNIELYSNEATSWWCFTTTFII